MKILRESRIEVTPRVFQIRGMFDLEDAKTSIASWSFETPDLSNWLEGVGVIVGPSGSGKSTVAEELFPGRVFKGNDWPQNKSVVDGFPDNIGIKDITSALSSVGFSSPPNWLRPYAVLSNGEKFRADLALALCQTSGTTVGSLPRSRRSRKEALTSRSIVTCRTLTLLPCPGGHRGRRASGW